MAAVWGRSNGAHVAPRAARRTRSSTWRAAPAHAAPRVLPGPLSAVFLAVIGGSLALAAVVPSAAPPAPPPPPTTVVLAADVSPAAGSASVLPGADLDTPRASRSRRGPVVLEQPPPAPPPPPPPPVLPGCSGRAGSKGSNGRLSSSVLCRIPGTGESLRADAAVDFMHLANAYEAHFGRAICLTDGYRSLAEQVAVRRMKPRLAARPGTSEHGNGLAVDLACGVQSFRSAEHAWMRANAPRFGWQLPVWARRGGAKPEPWHWEYVGR